MIVILLKLSFYAISKSTRGN